MSSPDERPLTELERKVTRIALRDYLFESERYLRGVMPDRHDPCCEAERARREHFAVMQAALHLRVDSVRSAITALGFTLEDSTKDFNEP